MHDWLRARAASAPDALALIDADTGTQQTYSELHTEVETLAVGLESLDIGPGARVGTVCPRGLDAITLVWAILRTGATLVPLDFSAPPGKLVELVDTAGLDHVVLASDFTDRLDSAFEARVRLHELESLIEAGIGGETDGIDPAARSPKRSGFPGPDETCLLLFTSGTTGEPKAVRLTPRNLGSSAAGSAFRLGVEPADRWLLTLPLHHMGGLAIPLRAAQYGTAVVIERNFDAESTAANVENYGATGISLVPTMLKRLLDKAWRPESLRFALVGGAPTPSALAQRALEAGVPLYTTYGMTETASQIATATPSELRRDPSTVGRPLRTVSVSILKEDDTRCEPGEAGDIAVSGPVVSPGYVDGSWAKDETGSFHTGDVGYLDTDGRLYVTGRRSDQIITGGENVHPKEVEHAFRQLDSVDDVAVVGLPDEEWGERVAALVVPADESTVSALEAAVAESVAEYAVPKTISFTESIPRTSSGTVDRARVRELLSVRDD